jgi:hypothetical protein
MEQLTKEEKVIRQTFMIGDSHLDTLKDLVYTKRKSGEFEYTQKDALHQALDLLFATTKIVKRPEQIRVKEKARSTKIREAKK